MSAAGTRDGRLEVEGAGGVSTRLRRPAAARALLALAHGAGAGMTHPFLEAMAEALAERGVATLRFQFPYTEAGRRRPDARPVLLATLRAALAAAAREADGLPLLAGGKSMGGRMTSLLAAQEPPGAVRGIVFLGFPLHAAGRPGSERAAHLHDVALPMLFLQGDRDRLAEIGRMRAVCAALGARARLHEVAGADHGFHVLRRSGRRDEDVREELADAVAAFAASVG